MELETLTFALTSQVLPWALKILGAVAVFVVGRAAAGWLRRLTRRSLERSRADETLVPFVGALVYWGVLAFVVVAVLGLFGVPTASFVAVLGAAGLAVGLALQGTLSNFASGVMLLVFRPFAVGDYVEVAGEGGTVQAIRLFSTELTSPDNVEIVVPNREVYGGKLKNYSARDTRRIDLVMGVGYDDDLAAAEATIRRVLEEEPRLLEEPEPVVAVDELADSSVNFVVRPWCETPDYWQVRRDLTRRLKEELEAAGCQIPYPQRDVHLFQEVL